MLVIGLTGGIGSGKSTVARHFQSLGVPVIDADEITRELVEPGQEALKEVIAAFGNEFLLEDGQLNRALIRDRVFNNPADRKILENILHPRARKLAQQRINKLNTPYCILSAPLLIESGWTDMVHRVLVVDSPRDLQIQRTVERDGISKKQVEAIINSQIDREARLAMANEILENNSDITSLQRKIEDLHSKYTHFPQTNKEL